MRLFLKLLIILLIPSCVLAQDPAIITKQGNLMANALLKGDLNTLADYTYPKLVLMMGGKEKMIDAVNKELARMKADGFVFEDASVGTPGKFYKAGDEIHCIVPEIITMKIPKGHATAHSNLLAVSKDGGKNWTFIDLNKNTISSIPKLLPNFNHDLKIPEPSQPVMSN